MRERKIIHIYERSYDGSYFSPQGSDDYYLAGWASSVAKQTTKYDSKYSIEIWRPEREVQKPLSRNIQGIQCRLFPVRSIRRYGDLSLEMLREIGRQRKKHAILLHHHSIHHNTLYLLAFLFGRSPIVVQHHGDLAPLKIFRHKKRFRPLLKYFIEKKALRNVDHFFVLRNDEKEMLSAFLDPSRITVQTMGVDFDEFKPLNKHLARAKLGIPDQKKVILYVGKFYRLKGVDIILKTYEDLKSQCDIELILVGGSPSDSLYQQARSSGARVYGYLPHHELQLFYSAADVCLLPAFSSDYGGGIGVASVEALACGVPIITPVLKEFPAMGLEKLGKVPKDESDTEECILEILKDPHPYKDCREIAKAYFDWKTIISRTVRLYDRLFAEYYPAEKTDGLP